MKAGDTVKVIRGKHEGEIGELVAEWIAIPENEIESEGLQKTGKWLIELHDRRQVWIKKAYIKIVKPE